jgi:hypothetical protein
MWRCVDLVWTNVSEERIASIFRVENPRVRDQREKVAADCSTRFKRHNIPEDGILHSHRRENLKSYMDLIFVRYFVSKATPKASRMRAAGIWAPLRNNLAFPHSACVTSV